MKIKFVIGIILFVLSVIYSCSGKEVLMTVAIQPDGQYVVCESGNPVLQYNYRLVHEQDVVRPQSQKDLKIEYHPIEDIYVDEYYKSNPEVDSTEQVTSAIWAIPRSNYIHPLYGLEGEMLTNDWPDAHHPHHRGIFWGWPEVEFRSMRGDLYALQRVFARPTGNIKINNGDSFAEIEAENLWIWEDKDTIVNELSNIKVYPISDGKRIIDLTISLRPLVDSITIATRFTNSYGGLNIRMATPINQDISYYTDLATDSPRRSWADFSGIFEGNRLTSGLTIMQSKDNPQYPGDWIEYPDLSWIQPTFPTPDTRYLLSKDQPLKLRYRLIVHQGEVPNSTILAKQWDDYNINLN